MAEIVGGLFGITPEALMAQREQQAREQAMQFAKMGTQQKASYGYSMLGNQLGNAIGGLMGAQDPEMAKAAQRQSLLQQARPSDAEGWKSLASQLWQAGDAQGAQEAFAKAQALTKEATALGKATAETASSLATAAKNQFGISPEGRAQELLQTGKYDPSSVANFVAGRGDLVPIDKFTKPRPEFVEAAGELGFGDKPRYGDYTAAQIAAANQLAFNRSLQKAAANRQTINLPPQEKAEQVKRGEMLVNQYSDISKQASVAARTLPALESSLNIMDKGFDTGFGTETLATGAKVLAALGVEDAKSYATNAQSFLGAASQAVLTRQLEQKGPQTESDAARITQTGAQLGNTKEANRFLVSVAKAQFKRDLKQREFYDKWFKANKTYDGAEDAWFSSEGGKSLFDSPELQKYRASVSAASQIPAGNSATPAQAPIYAKNPTTNQRIVSTDGGVTWTPTR